MADRIPDLHHIDSGQCFPLWLYEKTESQDGLIAGYEKPVRRPEFSQIPGAVPEQPGKAGAARCDVIVHPLGLKLLESGSADGYNGRSLTTARDPKNR